MNKNHRMPASAPLMAAALSTALSLSACTPFTEQRPLPIDTVPIIEAAPPDDTVSTAAIISAAETWPEAYASLLAQYTDALQQRLTGETLLTQGLSHMLADQYGDTPFQNIGYAVLDLDGDGTEELLIGTTDAVTDEFYRKLIFDLYTLSSDGTVRQVFSSTERDRIYYVGDNRFASLGANSAADSFDTTVKLEDGELIDMTYLTPPGDYVQLPFLSLNSESENEPAVP